jgi:DHA2 family multidrug resistance protein-like MFS transporter
VLANTLAAFMMLGASILSTQYIQEVLGYSPLTGALWSVVPGVLVSGAAFGATTMGRQLGAGKVVAGGFVVSAVGFVVFASIGVHSGLWLLLVAVAVYAAGFLAVMALSTELMLGAVEPDRAAAAASVSETCGELGGALGMALIGSVVAAVYRSHMSSAPAAAKQNLADAVANTKPGGAGTVLAQARTAFVDGMHVVGFAGAAVLVLAAVAAAMFLKKVGAGTSSAPNHSEGATQAAVEEPAAAQVNLAAVSPALPEQRTPGTVGNKDEVDAATILPSTAADREQTGDGAQVAV